MEREWRRENGGPLRRIHQPGRAESYVIGRGLSRQCIGEPVQLLGSQWQLHLLRSGCGEAEHQQSDVGSSKIHAELRGRYQHEWQFDTGCESVRVDNFCGKEREDDCDGDTANRFIQ